MCELLVIADDFTGALDTGTLFAQKGIDTRVVINAQFESSFCTSTVVVIDSETRHMRPGAAYDIVRAISCDAVKAGVPFIYKKTDSALRGCVGAELAAVIDGAGGGVKPLTFVPALPSAGRTTKAGVQYIYGTPVSDSEFGRDPFDPVRCSYIPDIIAEQTAMPTRVSADMADVGKHIGITVCDAQNDDDMKKTATALRAALSDEKPRSLMAGCAGFAQYVDGIIDLSAGEISSPRKTHGMFTVCGSLNRVSVGQVEYARKNGFKCFSLTAEQKLMPDYMNTEGGRAFISELRDACQGDTPVILDAFTTVKDTERYAAAHNIDAALARKLIAARLGNFVHKWLSFELDHTLVVFGGDTLAGFMKSVGCSELHPVCELAQGVVCSRAENMDGRELQIVSKAGGFGTESVLKDIAEVLI